MDVTIDTLLDIKTLILLNSCCMDQSHREIISYKNFCNMSNPCKFIEKAGGASVHTIHVSMSFDISGSTSKQLTT